MPEGRYRGIYEYILFSSQPERKRPDRFYTERQDNNRKHDCRLKIHPVQYLFTGFVITIFYALLLAMSAHVGFDMAYLIASLAIIGLISGYAKSILQHLKASLVLGLTTLLLYGYLYLVIQLDAYALLVGSSGLFAMLLATVIYLTRRIDWYALHGDAFR